MTGEAFLEGLEAGAEDLSQGLGALQQAVLLEGVQHGQGRGAGHGVAPIGAAQAAHVGMVHELGAAHHGGQGQAPAQALGRGHDIGLHAPVLHGVHGPGAAHAGLDLVGDEDDAELLADGLQAGEIVGRRDDEPALAGDGLDDQAGHLLRGHVVDEETAQPLGAGHAAVRVRQPQGAAVAVGGGHAVDLGRVGSEAELVGIDLGGQGHGQQGPAVEPGVEGDDPASASGVAGYLDGVLHGLGPGVDQQGLLGERAGGEGGQAFGQLHVALVHGDVEARVQQAIGLLLDGGHHAGVAVAHVHDPDAAREVDDLAAVHIGDEGSLGGLDEDVREVRHAPGDGLVSPRLELLSLGCHCVLPLVWRRLRRRCAGAMESTMPVTSPLSAGRACGPGPWAGPGVRS